MKYIVSTTHSGFGNRIKSIASIMGKNLIPKVYWKSNPLVTTSFDELIEDKSLEVFRFPRGLFYFNRKLKPIFPSKIWFSPFFDISDFNLGDYRSQKLFDTKKNKEVQINNGLSIDYMYNHAPKNITDIFRERIRKIKPIKEIHEASRKFVSEVIGGDFVGAHVRTWSSHRSAHEEPRRYSLFNVNSWQKNLNSSLNDGYSNLYLATDNLEHMWPIMTNYEGSIFCKKHLKAWMNDVKLNFNDDQFAFVEMLILSQCNKLFASKFSSFGEVAWYYNSSPIDVNVV